ncbi:filamentous hemagglutinin N-terminal domain-containing protein [Chroococcus sp. FPU101]|uniref:two-partner secretion domain-containing protein n=1 Tax=Chroococcus sp. FPU101 TaxID=1974212 RepID=UPI001A8F606A|nr:filamentous hemagglutinin N-terminal domain-containing protein [Chroococcus sp. FPU101]GFE69982.1 hypothetical protein CFPU101_25920 [Chroococcus sp. FPU101]
MTQLSFRLTFGIILTLLNNLIDGRITIAQIIPDSSLGAESSRTRPDTIKNLPSDVIEGGATRGSNLFHSFREFNVNEGSGAYFANSGAIQNIFSRVTGGNISQIFGTLGVLGNANLFLINPNGIIFGAKASLDVGGSFVTTTANAVQFGNQGFFSVSEPQAPPLLTVNPSALLFNQLNAQRIENRSIAPAGLDSFKSPLSGLRVPDGRSLLFVGGEIVIDGGGGVHTVIEINRDQVKEVVNAGLHALGGRIELGGVAEPGIVGLDFLDDQGNLLHLSFPDNLARANMLLTNRALIDARATNPNLSTVGNGIQLQGGRVEITNGTQIVTDTQTSQKAGDIIIRASQLIISGSRISTIAGDPNSRMTGNAGSLTVNATESMEINAEAKLKPVQLRINRREIQTRTIESGLFTQTNGSGNSGEMLIKTGHLSVQNGAEISTRANNRSQGNAGLMTVTATELVEVVGKDSKLVTQSDGSGDAGNLTIKTRQLIAKDGGRLQTDTLERGQAGTLIVEATESVEVSGRGTDGYNSRLSAAAQENFTAETGDGGDIIIETKRLSVLNGGRVTTSTITGGNAGNITIKTGELIVGGVLSGDVARITTFTSGGGKPGSIYIKADSISLFDNGLISAAVNPRASGNAQRQGGNINIQTRTLSITNEAQILASTAKKDQAGNIKINAEEIELSGEGGLSVAATEGGRAGNLTVTTGKMIIENGAQVSVSSPQGQAGNIDITANSLSMNRGTISAETGQSQDEQGGAKIKLQVSDVLLMNNESTISAIALINANGGNITISAQDIRLQNDSDLRTNVLSGVGGGGDITLSANSILAFNDSDILAFAQDGIGGNIILNTPVFFGNGYQATDKVNQNPNTLNHNNRVDLNASGAVSGVISVPDLTFIQNSLFELPETLINTDNLIASSCVVPNQEKPSTYILTGPDELPTRPNNHLSSPYPTGTVETIPNSSPAKIEEPSGFFRLNDGIMVLSKKCYY